MSVEKGRRSRKSWSRGEFVEHQNLFVQSTTAATPRYTIFFFSKTFYISFLDINLILLKVLPQIFPPVSPPFGFYYNTCCHQIKKTNDSCLFASPMRLAR